MLSSFSVYLTVSRVFQHAVLCLALLSFATSDVALAQVSPGEVKSPGPKGNELSLRSHHPIQVTAYAQDEELYTMNIVDTPLTVNVNDGDRISTTSMKGSSHHEINTSGEHQIQGDFALTISTPQGQEHKFKITGGVLTVSSVLANRLRVDTEGG